MRRLRDDVMAKDEARIIVTVDAKSLKSIKEVAERLASEGMTVFQILPITGLIIGSCEPGIMSALKKLSGVSSVEEEMQIQLPPSNSTLL